MPSTMSSQTNCQIAVPPATITRPSPDIILTKSHDARDITCPFFGLCCKIFGKRPKSGIYLHKIFQSPITDNRSPMTNHQLQLIIAAVLKLASGQTREREKRKSARKYAFSCICQIFVVPLPSQRF